MEKDHFIFTKSAQNSQTSRAPISGPATARMGKLTL